MNYLTKESERIWRQALTRDSNGTGWYHKHRAQNRMEEWIEWKARATGQHITRKQVPSHCQPCFGKVPVYTTLGMD